MRVRKNFRENIMKSVFSLALAFGIVLAGCTEKELDPVIVSTKNQENPHSPVPERPAEEVPIVEIIPQELTIDWIAPEQETKQANGNREPDVIFVPTPQDVVDRMLELVQVTKDDLLYDLGCGDGRIVVTAAKRYGCRAVGYDIDPERVKESLQNVQKNNVGHLVTIEQKDIFTLDLSEANVITLYLLPSLNVKLFPQLEKLKPGSRIVSHEFNMRGVKPDKVIRLNSSYDQEGHKIYLWTTPLEVMVKKNPDADSG
jgi:SAM-dependent methyltransferase